MNSEWWKLGCRLGTVAAVGLSAIAVRAADEQPQGGPPAIVRAEAQANENVPVDGQAGKIIVSTESPQARVVRVFMADHWLGLDCWPVSPAMCSQLKLDGDSGLVIESLAEEGPASKAGLKQYDILLTAGDVKLKEVADLVKLLHEGKDKEIEFHILRGGEKLTVKVTPEKRPQPAPGEDLLRLRGGDDKALELLREQLGKAQMPLRLQFFHPGVMLPQGVAAAAAIPENLHIHLDKQGGQPAKIVVERGDDRWETTEDKLDKLPADVRPHVEGLLGRMAMPKFDVEVDTENMAAPSSIPRDAEVSKRLERRLEELSRRMDQFGEQVEQLRSDRNDTSNE